MDREGIGKVRRAELLARLSALEQQIEAQAGRVRRGREMGWEIALSEQRPEPCGSRAICIGRP